MFKKNGFALHRTNFNGEIIAIHRKVNCYRMVLIEVSIPRMPMLLKMSMLERIYGLKRVDV